MSLDAIGSRMLATEAEASQDLQLEATSLHEQQQHIEDLISSLPLVRYLRSHAPTPESESKLLVYSEFRLHSNMSPMASSAHLVSGSLFGEDKLPAYPRLFVQKEPVCRMISVCYIGTKLCGHPGYVHGGVLFSLFDDIFARCAAVVFPSSVGMTANLNINFRKPSLPDRLYVVRAEVERGEGRKLWVTGSIRCLGPFTASVMATREPSKSADLSTEENEADLVAEATSLFVEPKFANSMEPLFRNF
ncbi:hypothetical protein GQ53DRAFT_836230 [Thozetella sp. PMI_491]|nr:hypothetical protein GQ53DRAFT_836230 [Thozetella sp. PMI_491]